MASVNLECAYTTMRWRNARSTVG